MRRRSISLRRALLLGGIVALCGVAYTLIVAGVARGVYPAGEHELIWNGEDAAGRPVSPGIYWLRLTTTGGCAASRSVLAIR